MNKHLYLCHPLVLTSPTLMMRGHMNLKFIKLSVRRALKHMGGMDVYLLHFLTSELDGDKRQASRPGRFTWRKETVSRNVRET